MPSRIWNSRCAALARASARDSCGGPGRPGRCGRGGSPGRARRARLPVLVARALEERAPSTKSPTCACAGRGGCRPLHGAATGPWRAGGRCGWPRDCAGRRRLRQRGDDARTAGSPAVGLDVAQVDPLRGHAWSSWQFARVREEDKRLEVRAVGSCCRPAAGRSSDAAASPCGWPGSAGCRAGDPPALVVPRPRARVALDDPWPALDLDQEEALRREDQQVDLVDAARRRRRTRSSTRRGRARGRAAARGRTRAPPAPRGTRKG